MQIVKQTHILTLNCPCYFLAMSQPHCLKPRGSISYLSRHEIWELFENDLWSKCMHGRWSTHPSKDSILHEVLQRALSNLSSMVPCCQVNFDPLNLKSQRVELWIQFTKSLEIPIWCLDPPIFHPHKIRHWNHLLGAKGNCAYLQLYKTPLKAFSNDRGHAAIDSSKAKLPVRWHQY